MHRQEIPREEWREFFDSFSRQHEGWLTSVEMDGRPTADRVPLSEISSDGTNVEVVFGKPPDRRTHSVHDAARVMLEETEPGAHAGVLIETTQGQSLSLMFRVAAHPELLDGVL